MTPHKFEQFREPEQWGQRRGGRPDNAASYWHCVRCGVQFVHRYNLQPDIYKAIKDAGIDIDSCPHDDSEAAGIQDAGRAIRHE